METEEALRPDAQREVAALLADGLEVWILSGDSVARTRAMAARLGLPEERAIGGQRPEDKAEWLRAHAPEETLFVGDGINDGPAAEVALASGTPAIDRPFMPARSDFYFVTAGLAPVRELLLEARRLARVVRGCLAFAVVYNLGAVALAYAGLVEPWVAAVLMPISSVVTLAGAALAMRAPAGRSRWRS
ncbi:MAG: HAD family hydrolase [Sandaracinaceae bacterium]|nr:MAG: HAD family hydrolase [Sandaracinaceae bacterium]